MAKTKEDKKEEKSENGDLPLSVVTVDSGDVATNVGSVITTGYNESLIDEASRPRVRALVAKIQFSLNRILSAAIDSGESLKELHGLMPYDEFQLICTKEFKISSSTAWRYMRAFEYVAVNFTEEERLNLIPKFNLSAIEFLSSSANEVVTPEMVKDMANNTDDKKLISRKSIEDLISDMEETVSEQLSEISDLKAGKTNAERLADSYKGQVTSLELAATRAQTNLINRSHEINGLMQEVQDKNKELTRLRLELEEKPETVAMIPAEYATVADAIQKLESDLDDLRGKETKLKESIATLTSEARIAQGAVEDAKSLQAALNAFIHDMQMLVTKHDKSVISNAMKIANEKTREIVTHLMLSVKELDVSVA